MMTSVNARILIEYDGDISVREICDGVEMSLVGSAVVQKLGENGNIVTAVVEAIEVGLEES